MKCCVCTTSSTSATGLSSSPSFSACHNQVGCWHCTLFDGIAGLCGLFLCMHACTLVYAIYHGHVHGDSLVCICAYLYVFEHVCVCVHLCVCIGVCVSASNSWRWCTLLLQASSSSRSRRHGVAPLDGLPVRAVQTQGVWVGRLLFLSCTRSTVRACTRMCVCEQSFDDYSLSSTWLVLCSPLCALQVPVDGLTKRRVLDRLIPAANDSHVVAISLLQFCHINVVQPPKAAMDGVLFARVVSLFGLV